jgi:hypothetical protein
MSITAAAASRGTTGTLSLLWIIGASSVGTLIEWYDFYLYGVLALFFSKHFFSPELNPSVAFHPSSRHPNSPLTRGRIMRARRGRGSWMAGRPGRAVDDRPANPICEELPGALRGSDRAACGEHEGVGLDESGARRRGGRSYSWPRKASRGPPAWHRRGSGDGRARLVGRAEARLCHRRQPAGAKRGLGPRTPRPRTRRTDLGPAGHVRRHPLHARRRGRRIRSSAGRSTG